MEYLFCDSRKCTGCHACEVACAVEHSPSKALFLTILNSDAAYPRRAVQTVGTSPYRAAVDGRATSLGCHHCMPAACVDACISGAMQKQGEETICDVSKCVGCWMCVMVCSYGAITPRKTALKCDLCPDRQSRTGRSRYACIEACPTEALVAGAFQEFQETLSRPVAMA